MGAFEVQPTAPELPGDYNLDSTVDTSDYVMWRSALGSSIAAYSGADGNGNGTVDQPDCDVWRAHFGMTLPPLDAGSGATAAAALAVNVEPSGIRPDDAGSMLPAPSAREVTATASDAVFEMFGQPTPSRTVAAKKVLPKAAIEASASDPLLQVRLTGDDQQQSHDSAIAETLPLQDTDVPSELTVDRRDKWHRVARESFKLSPIVS
jgi:hypothetical protein